MKKEAVIVVDYQEDFANPEIGTLYVNGWEKIAGAINDVVREVRNKWWLIITSRELHPVGHISFASNFVLKESIVEAFKRGEAPNYRNFITKAQIQNWTNENNGIWVNAEFTLQELKAYLDIVWDQALWPNHCVAGTKWADYYKDFDTSMIDLEIKKGYKADTHPYSAFGWKTMDEKDNLIDVLKKYWINLVKIVWLATDYCDVATVLDARNEGIETQFIEKASAWVDKAWTIEALKKMREAWAKII